MIFDSTIAVANWTKVEQAFAQLDRHGVLAPTLAAMRMLANMVRNDPRFADVAPMVSHASLVLSRGQSKRRVSVSWHEGNDYSVSFVDPPQVFSDKRIVSKGSVLQVIREYLDKLQSG